MTLTPIVQEGTSLRAIAAINGRTKYPVFLRLKSAGAELPPLAADDLNLNAASERATLVDQLEPQLRAEATTLLLQLAEGVAARRAQKPRAKATDEATAARVLDPNDPMATARQFIADRFTEGMHRLVYAWRGDLYAHAAGHYRPLDEQALRAALYVYLERAQRPAKGGAEPFRPTATVINNVVDAFRGVAHLDSTVQAPSWLDGRATPKASELIAVANGHLHYPTRRLLPASPHLFTLHGLPFSYDPKVGEAVEWLKFLRAAWPDDQAAIDTLQEIFGYLLVGDLRQQKMFMLVGPKRAGKDTIARILRSLVGPENCAGPTLSGLAGPFGLQTLIGKPLAIIADARLSGRLDATVIVERLLAVTGGGHLSVERKHRDAWNGELPTRFLMLSNELPRLEDASGALASRFIVLTMTQSWYGREDTTLYDRLVQELPAILCWALDGLERLWDRGRFTTPASSANAVQELEDLGSPIRQFVRERCVVDAGFEVEVSVLYDAWRRWSEQHGRSHVSTQQVFGRDLRAAVPGLAIADRRQGERRYRVYAGLRIVGQLL